MMEKAKIERKKNPKATSRTSFRPRIVDSSAPIVEEKNKRGKQQQAGCRRPCLLPGSNRLDELVYSGEVKRQPMRRRRVNREGEEEEEQKEEDVVGKIDQQGALPRPPPHWREASLRRASATDPYPPV